MKKENQSLTDTLIENVFYVFGWIIGKMFGSIWYYLKKGLSVAKHNIIVYFLGTVNVCFETNGIFWSVGYNWSGDMATHQRSTDKKNGELF